MVIRQKGGCFVGMDLTLWLMAVLFHVPLLLFFIAAALVEIESMRMKKRLDDRGRRAPHAL